MLPHLVCVHKSAARCLANLCRIELGDPAGREDREPDLMAMEQLEQSPDPRTAPEFALGELQRRLTEHPAEELRVEVEREVDGEAHAVRVPPAIDVLVSSHPARLSDIEQRQEREEDARCGHRRGCSRCVDFPGGPGSRPGTTPGRFCKGSSPRGTRPGLRVGGTPRAPHDPVELCMMPPKSSSDRSPGAK